MPADAPLGVRSAQPQPPSLPSDHGNSGGPKSCIRPFSEIESGDLPLVGGKGLNLGLMLRAGLPVPDGFCLMTGHGAAGQGEAGDAATGTLERNAQDLLAAYNRLGAGLVAVRS